MHILIIHQAFASLDEPGGTRHYEFARLLAARGHQVTVIASPVSYITGVPTPSAVGTSPIFKENGGGWDGVRILRARVYSAHHKSFFHRIIAFFSFMFSSFWIGLGVKNVDLVWGTSPPIFQGVTAWLLARLKGAKFLFEVRDLWPQFAVAVGVLKNPISDSHVRMAGAILISPRGQGNGQQPGIHRTCDRSRCEASGTNSQWRGLIYVRSIQRWYGFSSCESS